MPLPYASFAIFVANILSLCSWYHYFLWKASFKLSSAIPSHHINNHSLMEVSGHLCVLVVLQFSGEATF
jgi:hypothetical protein